MNLKNKIIIIAGLIGAGSLLYFLLRKPKLNIVNVFWDKNTGIYNFGGIEKEFSRNSGKLVNDAFVIENRMKAGKNYISDAFLNISNSLDKKKTFFKVVDKNNNVIQEITIDWFSKLKY
jgi:hypothetical protein